MCTHCYRLASDEARHRILTALKSTKHTVSELTEILHVKQPTVSHHLKQLADAGLVHVTQVGRTREYSLAEDNECFSECGLLHGLVEKPKSAKPKKKTS